MQDVKKQTQVDTGITTIVFVRKLNKKKEMMKLTMESMNLKEDNMTRAEQIIQEIQEKHLRDNVGEDNGMLFLLAYINMVAEKTFERFDELEQKLDTIEQKIDLLK